MNRVSRPALRGSLLGMLLRLWNPVMRRILESPIHWPWSGWFAVLTWTGRRSGRAYSTPIAYVREGSTVWVTTGDRWWRNLVDGAPVRIRVAGRWRDARGTPVTDLADSTVNARAVCSASTRGSGGCPASPATGPAAPIRRHSTWLCGQADARADRSRCCWAADAFSIGDFREEAPLTALRSVAEHSPCQSPRDGIPVNHP